MRVCGCEGTDGPAERWGIPRPWPASSAEGVRTVQRQNHSLKVDNEPNQYVALLHINKLKVKDSDTVNNLSIANAKGTTMYQFRIQKMQNTGLPQ